MAVQKFQAKQQIATQKRREELEAIFQERQEELLNDFNAYELSMKELQAKWGTTERTIRRWMERLGIDSYERYRARRLKMEADKPAKPIKRVKSAPDYDKPQAHKLAGLW